MRQAYLDCSSGISGDMLLGALLDVGLPPDRLFAELKKIPLGFYEFKRTRAVRGGLVGTRVEVRVPERQPKRKLEDVREIIKVSPIPDGPKEQALKVFWRLAEVEGRLHNMPPEKVHFHEVGAVDSVIDIVGACLGFDLLGISEFFCSPLNLGGGQVETRHGTLPVPAPATAELLKGIPVYSSGVDGELVTPTGAALVATLAAGFGSIPAMKIEQIGYGAGNKQLPGRPNVLRLFLGERAEVEGAQPGPPGDEIVSVIEANVDDMSPQLYGYLVEEALAAGALDVTCSAVQMKKNRPGLLVSIICAPEQSDALAELFFDQTTTIGVRIYEARRKVLDRELLTVNTPYGPVRMKVAKREGRIVNAAPEYDDCERLAKQKSVPLKQVMLAAQLAFSQQSEPPAPPTAEGGQQDASLAGEAETL